METIINKIIRDRKSTWPLNFDPDRKIEQSVISEILETAIWAPSHGLTQPWKFFVFQGDGVRTFFNKQKEIYLEITPPEQVKESKLAKYDEKVKRVSHIIAVCMERDKKRKYPEIEEIVATACVIENIYLCLSAFGIAGYLSTGDICYTQQMKDYLGLGEEDKCLGFFQLGYAVAGINRPKRTRIPASEKTKWIVE